MAGATKHESCLRERWRDLVASVDGPSASTTRHVLLTLSLHMDISGYCFPSTRLLAERTGVSERAVCAHLALGADSGWISKSRRQGASGQGWRRNQYQATLPKALTRGKHLTPQGTDPRSARSAEGTDPHDEKALTEGQSNQSKNQSGVQTEVKESALTALDNVCAAMGVGWDHKTLTRASWIHAKATDDRFKGLDFTAVFSDAADFLSSDKCTRAYKSPTVFLLYQLKMAAKRVTTTRPTRGHASLRAQA